MNAQMPSCAARGSEQLKSLIEAALADEGLEIPIQSIRCLGQCTEGPNLLVVPNGRMFNRFDEQKLPTLVSYLRSEMAAAE